MAESSAPTHTERIRQEFEGNVRRQLQQRVGEVSKIVEKVKSRALESVVGVKRNACAAFSEKKNILKSTEGQGKRFDKVNRTYHNRSRLPDIQKLNSKRVILRTHGYPQETV